MSGQPVTIREHIHQALLAAGPGPVIELERAYDQHERPLVV